MERARVWILLGALSSIFSWWASLLCCLLFCLSCFNKVHVWYRCIIILFAFSLILSKLDQYLLVWCKDKKHIISNCCCRWIWPWTIISGISKFLPQLKKKWLILETSKLLIYVSKLWLLFLVSPLPTAKVRGQKFF